MDPDPGLYSNADPVLDPGGNLNADPYGSGSTTLVLDDLVIIRKHNANNFFFGLKFKLF